MLRIVRCNSKIIVGGNRALVYAGTTRDLSTDNKVDWYCKHTWKRARVNTIRCLVGCTIGDLSMLFYLQQFHPDMNMVSVMGLSMASGLITSFSLETVLLKFGKDNLSWSKSIETAFKMSIISMVSMEVAENVVEITLTNGVVDLADPFWYFSISASVLAGFLVPLPYNYYMLKKYNQSCH